MPTNVFYNGFSSALFSTVNVLAYGAVGDGVADDTKAIQAALDALKTTGGTIHFPVGIYRLTKSVYFYSNQELIFEHGATLLQGAEINNLMMNYSTADKGGYNATQNVIIDGATFDGGNYTTPNTLFGICHSQNITIRDCRFINAYGHWHNVEINSSKNVLIDRCYFEGSRKNAENGELIQIDSFNNTATWPWGNGLVDGTVSYLVEVKNCFFTNCTVSPAIGNHSEAVVNCIRIHDNTFEGFTSSRGAINFYNAKNVDVYNNTFINCNTGVTIGTADNTNTVHDNRFIGVTTVSGSGINTYGNMVNENIESTGTGLSDALKSALKTYFTNMQTLLPQLAYVSENNIGATLIVNAQAVVTALDASGTGTGGNTHSHSYTSSVTTEATCTAAGVRTYTCSCGLSYTQSIPAIGHNYVDGVCTVCGDADPTYGPDTPDPEVPTARDMFDFENNTTFSLAHPTYNHAAYEVHGKNTVKISFADVGGNAVVYFDPKTIEAGKTYTLFAKIDGESTHAQNVLIRMLNSSVQLNLYVNGGFVHKTVTTTEASLGSAFIAIGPNSSTTAGDAFMVTMHLYEGTYTEMP